MLAYKHKAFTMAAKKISPLYANLIDYLDTYNASVYKHHKTDNKIYIWVKQTIFNYNFASDVKTATYTYFKDLIGFFLPSNVKIETMPEGNYKLTIIIPKGHEAKLLTVSNDEEVLLQKMVITDIMRGATTEKFDHVTYKINSSSRHIRVYDIKGEEVAAYIIEMHRLFLEHGWLVTQIKEFNSNENITNIHFFYKKAA